MAGENDEYNYPKAAHLYPPFSYISCPPKYYKIAPALTIAKAVKTLSQKREFNAKRKLYSDRLDAFKTSILEDGIYSSTLMHSILQEIYTIEEKFDIVFSSFRDKITFALLKMQLKRKKHNFEKICTYLDYLIARLNIKED